MPTNDGGRLRRKPLLVAGGMALAALVLIAAVAVFIVLRELGRPGEATAKFLPASTQAYFNINLRPGNGQVNRFRKLRSSFDGTAGFLDRRDGFLEEIEDATGISFMDDVWPWLGRDISFALLDAAAENGPEWVMLLQTDDRDASEGFLKDLAQYLGDEKSMGLKTDTYEGALLYSEEMDKISFALTGDYVIIGSNEKAVRSTIRYLDDPPTLPLSKDERFLRVRDQLPSERFMLIFTSAMDLYGEAERQAGPNDLEAPAGLRRNIPEVVGVSGSFVDDGIRLDFYSDTPGGAVVVAEKNDLNTASAIPEDALLMLSFTGIQEVWPQVGRMVEIMGVYTTQELDRFLGRLTGITGVDVEQDIIGELIGETTLALLPSDFRMNEFGQLGDAVEALLVADIGDSRDLERSVDKLTALVELGAGAQARSVNVGGYEAVVLDLDGLGGVWRDYSPGYLFTEDMVVFGTTVDALSGMVDTLAGTRGSLASAPEFSRLVDMMPEGAGLVLFADIAEIIETAVDAFPPAMRSDYDRDVRPLLEPLNVLLAAIAVNGETTHLTLILTVRE